MQQTSPAYNQQVDFHFKKFLNLLATYILIFTVLLKGMFPKEHLATNFSKSIREVRPKTVLGVWSVKGTSSKRVKSKGKYCHEKYK